MTTDAGGTPPDSRGIIRLEVQVEGLAKEVHRLNNIIMGANSPADVRFTQLEKSVNGRMESFDETQKALAATIDKLSDKLDQRSKFPFAQVFAFVGLLFTLGSGIGGIILNGIKSDVTRIERDVTTIQGHLVPASSTRADGTVRQTRSTRCRAESSYLKIDADAERPV